MSSTEVGDATGCSTGSGGEPAVPTPEPARGIRPIWFVLAFVGCLAAGGLLAVVAVDGSDSGPRVWSYTVPPGTGARIEAGEELYVFPARLDVKVGDQMVIINDDARPAEVGPYLVGRNATLTQTFTKPGIIEGFCSIHPSGKVTIEVHA